MKTIIILLILVGSLLGQTVPLSAPAPPPLTANQISGSVVGTLGNSSYFYWVVVNYPVGSAFAGGPVQVTRVPDTLSVSNFVRVNWAPMNGATSYAVLRTTTPTFPSTANCGCAVATGVTTTTTNDQSNTTSSYTLATVGPSTGVLSIDNLTQSTAFLNWMLNGGNYQVAVLSPSAVAGECTVKSTIPGVLISQACAAAGGTVSSVGMTGDNVIYNTSVTGSPVTTSGTLVPVLKTQTANTFFAGPASGAPATGAMRALVSLDIPNNAANTTGNANTATALAANPTDCSPSTSFANTIAANGNLGCQGELHVIEFSIDGGGTAIATGDLEVFPTANFACTINRIDISGFPSGSITVNVWKAAGAIPTAGNIISASAPLTLSATTLTQNGSIAGWTTAVAAGDVFGFTVATAATVERVTGQIWCR